MFAGVSERAWGVAVPHHPRGAGLARASLHAKLRELGIDRDLAADAVTVVSELVGNAARHARPLRGDVISVSCIAATRERVEVSVTDGGAAGMPTLRAADADAVDGRGLQIVAGLAARWGVEIEGKRRRVWAVLTA